MGAVLPNETTQDAHIEAPDGAAADWEFLSRCGGIAAFLLIFYCIATVIQLATLGGPPATAADAFAILQKNRFVGLARLDFPTVLAMLLYYPLFLGLFGLLKDTDHAKSLLATCMAFVGATLLLATPTGLSMLSLSEKFAIANTDAARIQLLAAGEAVLANDIWHGTGARIGGALLQCAGVLICIVMLGSRIFSKATARLGVVVFGLDLAHIFVGLLLPTTAAVLMAASGVLYPLWFFLAGRTLLSKGGESLIRH